MARFTAEIFSMTSEYDAFERRSVSRSESASAALRIAEAITEGYLLHLKVAQPFPELSDLAEVIYFAKLVEIGQP